MEADPRHVQVAAAALGLLPGASNGFSTPYTRPYFGARESSPVLSSTMGTLYRSTVMRLAYLSGDRPDVTYAVKELARRSQEPRELDMLGVKRAVLYLLSHERQVLQFPRQSAPLFLTAYSDSDHAGCKDSRKSTSAHVLFHGAHCLRASSGTQKLVATSSAEAEFYAGTRAASSLIGATRLFTDLGRPLETPRLYLDATGGIGMASRRGTRPVKQLATSSVWLQDAVFQRELKLLKVGTRENVADSGTKPLSGPELARLTKTMGYDLRHDPAEGALQSAWAAAE